MVKAQGRAYSTPNYTPNERLRQLVEVLRFLTSSGQARSASRSDSNHGAPHGGTSARNLMTVRPEPRRLTRGADSLQPQLHLTLRATPQG